MVCLDYCVVSDQTISPTPCILNSESFNLAHHHQVDDIEQKQENSSPQP